VGRSHVVESPPHHGGDAQRFGIHVSSSSLNTVDI
jgi:hypothetical protein